MNAKIPVFKREDEGRKFWAVADSTKYVNWKSPKRLKFVRLKPSPKTPVQRYLQPE